uniref:Uncharacterized protein n=1 Tax=Aegilops tauschii subsp. strangulata TaxID=200361 RepID=A0A453ITM9_AEGTS
RLACHFLTRKHSCTDCTQFFVLASFHCGARSYVLTSYDFTMSSLSS